MASGNSLFKFGATQNVAIGAASVASAAFGSQTYAIQICAIGGACHFAVGNSPTATGTSTYLPIGWPLQIMVAPGQQIAVIQDATSTGNLSVTELS